MHTDSQEHVIENVTAVIKVKDSPGALWNAIDKIGVSISYNPIASSCIVSKVALLLL